jgi:hypothetical protein
MTSGMFRTKNAHESLVDAKFLVDVVLCLNEQCLKCD